MFKTVRYSKADLVVAHDSWVWPRCHRSPRWDFVTNVKSFDIKCKLLISKKTRRTGLSDTRYSANQRIRRRLLGTSATSVMWSPFHIHFITIIRFSDIGAESPLSVKSGHTWTVCGWSFQKREYIYIQLRISVTMGTPAWHDTDQFLSYLFPWKVEKILLGGFERQKRNGGRGKDDEREEQNVIDWLEIDKKIYLKKKKSHESLRL